MEAEVREGSQGHRCYRTQSDLRDSQGQGVRHHLEAGVSGVDNLGLGDVSSSGHLRAGNSKDCQGLK